MFLHEFFRRCKSLMLGHINKAAPLQAWCILQARLSTCLLLVNHGHLLIPVAHSLLPGSYLKSHQACKSSRHMKPPCASLRPVTCRGLNLGLAFLVHSAALGWYLRVWLWHFTPAAEALPGARGFGWFFKYLTFYSYTLQLVQLSLCCCADLARVSTRQHSVPRVPVSYSY